MKIGLIGCGKVGLTLGYFLKDKNEIVGIYDVNKENIKRGLKILGLKKNPQLSQMAKESEVLFFATPDDEILNAFKKIKDYLNGPKYCFHFSGLLPAEIFPKDKYLYRGSMHPFTTFPRLIIPPKRKRYFFFFQGDDMAYQVARRIFCGKDFVIKKIERRYKNYYHLVGVFTNNLLVGLAGAINKLAKKINWQKKEFNEFIIPLFKETIENLKEFGIKRGLSGPIIRGDTKTIKMHLEVLKRDKDLLMVYKALSEMLLLCLPPVRRRKISRLLKSIH